MKIATTRFGEIELPDESLITFPEGIVGFPHATGFVIFDCGDDGIFKWLQSVNVPELAFVICEATLIVPHYQIAIGRKEQDVLQLENTENAAVCLILTIPQDPTEMTANLVGPIVMNAESRLGMQLVLVNPEYDTRHRVFAIADPSEGEDQHAGA